MLNSQIRSVHQNGSILFIEGAGFGSTTEKNQVLLGESGICTIIDGTSTAITCEIEHGPCGVLPVFVLNKDFGFVPGFQNSSAQINLELNSITPNQGSIGGGYTLRVIGRGFSSKTTAFVDGHLCQNLSLLDHSQLSCTVPPSSRAVNTSVRVTIIDSSCEQNATVSFNYLTVNTPRIYRLDPAYVTNTNDRLNITGSGFLNTSLTVVIGNQRATILESTTDYIVVSVPKLSPGQHIVLVNTSNGLAWPSLYLTYEFYVRKISPQTGSLFGGTDVYIDGYGFDNRTRVGLWASNEEIIPCQIVFSSIERIQCITSSTARQMIIEPTGVHPIDGIGFEWLPKLAVVEQGTVVTWKWNAPSMSKLLSYKIQQLANINDVTPLADGFNSGEATSIGILNNC